MSRSMPPRLLSAPATLKVVSSSILTWGESARVVLDGLPEGDAVELASRWGAAVVTGGASTRSDCCRLVVSGANIDSVEQRTRSSPPRVRTRFHAGSVEVGVGPHRVVLDSVSGPDCIVISPARRLDDAERELLVGAALGHLLARQGMAVLHACAFECLGDRVLGLGESFGGKTTISMAAVRTGGATVSDDLILAGLDPNGRVELRPLRTYWFLRGNTKQIIPKRLNRRMWKTDEGGKPSWVLRCAEGQTGNIDLLTPNVLWLLSIDRRLRESRVVEVPQAMSFAAMIRASSPLFLSRHFPMERDELMPVFRTMSEGCRTFRVRLGRRLLDDPEGEMTRLVEASR